MDEVRPGRVAHQLAWLCVAAHCRGRTFDYQLYSYDIATCMYDCCFNYWAVFASPAVQSST